MNALIARVAPLVELGNRLLSSLQSPLLLLMRLYVAQVFFLAGLTKIRDWETTLLLFTEEYKVPVLPPTLAAYAGTFGELVFPVLLVLGIGGRYAAVALFFVNIVAVISYPGLAEPALFQHYAWGAMLATLAIVGPGRWAADAWLGRWLVAPAARAAQPT
jgi:putative oxidoreductase